MSHAIERGQKQSTLSGEQALADLLALVEPTTLPVPSGPGVSERCDFGRARLLSLELKDFKCFKRKLLNFDDAAQGLSCLIGANSTGKSGILDALRFVLLRRVGRSPVDFLRRSRPAPIFARVTARFRCAPLEGEDSGAGVVITLAREVRPDVSRGQKAFSTFCWLSKTSGEQLQLVEEPNYKSCLHRVLRWGDGDLLLPQFSLVEYLSAERLLRQLPGELARLEGCMPAAPLLKRRSAKTPEKQLPHALAAGASRAEAWLARRVDEIYRELTREPLDEKMEDWGEGGQACLRRLPDGTFDLLTSARRGAAACGYGTPLSGLSDGAKDICALSLLLALPGMLAGLQDLGSPFVVLDEPDSRLDKRHACALHRFLSGPSGPKQCIWMSLGNHSAFPPHHCLDSQGDCSMDQREEEMTHHGDLELPPPYGRGALTPELTEPAPLKQLAPQKRGALAAQFMRQMSARLREETEAEEEPDS